MNKLYLVVAVLFTSIHSISWSMLTVRTIQSSHTAKKFFTKEKLEEESQTFLNNFGQESINRTSKTFCVLPLDSKQKVVPRLSYDQLVFLWFGVEELDIPLLTILCNGSEAVAHMYRDKAINELLQARARAKEWQKFGKMDMHHFMILKNSQIRLCEDVFLESVILPSDVPKFMDAIEILKKIEPEFDTRIITDSTKIYPSFGKQALSFWIVPLPFMSYKSKIAFRSIIEVERKMISLLKNMGIIVAPQYAGPMFFLIGLGFFIDFQYKRYHSNLNIKNNILPNQPKLTGNHPKNYNIWQ